MTRFVIALLFPCGVAVAAPVPKPPPKTMQEVFGTSAEAAGVTVEMTRRGELRATVAKEAAVRADAIDDTRPLVSKSVEGDFELTVRVTHTLATDADRGVGGGNPRAAAGVALVFDADRRLTLLHNQDTAGGRTSRLTAYSQFPGSSSQSSGGRRKVEDALYLRVTRKGDEISTKTSADGKVWESFVTHKVKGAGATVTVGPAAAHNTTTGYEVTFDEYLIKSLNEEKK